MTSFTPHDHDRLLELLAGAQLDHLGPEERAELEALRSRAPDPHADAGALVGELVLTMDHASRESATLPDALRSRLLARGRQMVTPGGSSAAPTARRPWLALAAAIAIVGLAAMLAIFTIRAQRQTDQLADLRARITENETLLADARAHAATLTTSLTDRESQNLELAQQLGTLTQDLARAEIRLAVFEAPVLPEVLLQKRQLLATVPGTVRMAFAPFDLPGNPAEQQGVTGYALWNDEEKAGYLTFQGLKVNDPTREQYQVWVIDERGMEQKVSGGVFNATAQGEVIVPIHPGIDVGRVALFAVTIEAPGGTWVPSLERRVVVAPREAT